jgi:hypothetical protein
MFSSFKNIMRYKQKFNTFININKRFIGTGNKLSKIGASYQTDTNKVRLRGKFLKSRNVDMPTMLWFPEVLESAENWENWFQKPDNHV